MPRLITNASTGRHRRTCYQNKGGKWPGLRLPSRRRIFEARTAQLSTSVSVFFATRPAVMNKVLGIVYLVMTTHW
jgi:hypothetical protein